MSSSSRLRDLVIRGGRGQQIGEAGPVHDDEFGLGLLRAAACLVRERMPGEDQPGPGVAEVVGDLPRLEQRVHRDDHAAGPEHAVVHHGDLGDVGHHDADPVAGLEAALVQQPGDPGARLVQCPVRHRRVVHPHGHPSGVGPGRVRQVPGQVRHAAHCPAARPGRSSVPGIKPVPGRWYGGTTVVPVGPRKRPILVLPARYRRVRPRPSVMDHTAKGTASWSSTS